MSYHLGFHGWCREKEIGKRTRKEVIDYKFSRDRRLQMVPVRAQIPEKRKTSGSVYHVSSVFLNHAWWSVINPAAWSTSGLMEICGWPLIAALAHPITVNLIRSYDFWISRRPHSRRVGNVFSGQDRCPWYLWNSFVQDAWNLGRSIYVISSNVSLRPRWQRTYLLHSFDMWAKWSCGSIAITLQHSFRE